MARDFTNADEGKHVMTADGDMVGTIEQVSGGMAHVSPDASLDRSIRQKLGWSEEGEATYELRSDHVDQFSGNEVHLKGDI